MKLQGLNKFVLLICIGVLFFFLLSSYAPAQQIKDQKQEKPPYDDFIFTLNRDYFIQISSETKPELAEALQFCINDDLKVENLSEEAKTYLASFRISPESKDMLYRALIEKIKQENETASTFIKNTLSYLKKISRIVEPVPLSSTKIAKITALNREVYCVAKQGQQDISALLELEAGRLVIGPNWEIKIINDTLELYAIASTNAQLDGFNVNDVERGFHVSFSNAKIKGDKTEKEVSRIETKYGSVDVIAPNFAISDVRYGYFVSERETGKPWQLVFFDLISGTEQQSALPAQQGKFVVECYAKPTCSLFYDIKNNYIEGKNIILDGTKLLENFGAEFNEKGEITKLILLENSLYIDSDALFSLSSPSTLEIYFSPTYLQASENAIFISETEEDVTISVNADIDLTRGKLLTFYKMEDLVELEYPTEGQFGPASKNMILIYKPEQNKISSLIIAKDGTIIEKIQTEEELRKKEEAKKKVPVLTPEKTTKKLNELAARMKSSDERVKSLRTKISNAKRQIDIFGEAIGRRKNEILKTFDDPRTRAYVDIETVLNSDPEIIKHRQSIVRAEGNIAKWETEISQIIEEDSKKYQNLITELKILEKQVDDPALKKGIQEQIIIIQDYSHLSRIDLLLSANRNTEAIEEANKLPSRLSDQGLYFKGIALAQQGHINEANLEWQKIKDKDIANAARAVSEAIFNSQIKGISQQYEQELAQKKEEYKSIDDLTWVEKAQRTINIFEWGPRIFGSKSYSEIKKEIKNNEVWDIETKIDGLFIIQDLTEKGKSFEEIQSLSSSDLEQIYGSGNGAASKVALQYALDDPEIKAVLKQKQGVWTREEQLNYYLEKASRAVTEEKGATIANMYLAKAYEIDKEETSKVAETLNEQLKVKYPIIGLKVGGLKYSEWLESGWGDLGITVAGDPIMLATAGLSAYNIGADVVAHFSKGAQISLMTKGLTAGERAVTMANKVSWMQTNMPTLSKAIGKVSQALYDVSGPKIWPRAAFYQQGYAAGIRSAELKSFLKGLPKGSYSVQPIIEKGKAYAVIKVDSPNIENINAILKSGELEYGKDFVGSITNFAPIETPQGRFGMAVSEIVSAKLPHGPYNIIFVSQEVPTAQALVPVTAPLQLPSGAMVPAISELSASTLAPSVFAEPIPAMASTQAAMAASQADIPTTMALHTFNPAARVSPEVAVAEPVVVAEPLSPEVLKQKIMQIGESSDIDIAFNNFLSKGRKLGWSNFYLNDDLYRAVKIIEEGIEAPRTYYAYHGTTDKFLESIKTNGLGKRFSPYGEINPGVLCAEVCLAGNTDAASIYAEATAREVGGKPVLLRVKISDKANTLEAWRNLKQDERGFFIHESDVLTSDVPIEPQYLEYRYLDEDVWHPLVEPVKPSAPINLKGLEAKVADVSTTLKAVAEARPRIETKFYTKKEAIEILGRDPLSTTEFEPFAGKCKNEVCIITDKNGNAWFRKIIDARYEGGLYEPHMWAKNEIFVRVMMDELKKMGLIENIKTTSAIVYYDKEIDSYVVLTEKISGETPASFEELTSKITLEERLELAVIKEIMGLIDAHKRNFVFDKEGELFAIDFEFAGKPSSYMFQAYEDPRQVKYTPYLSTTSYNDPKLFKPKIDAVKAKEQEILAAVDKAAAKAGISGKDLQTLKNNIKMNLDLLEDLIETNCQKANKAYGLNPPTEIEELEKKVLESTISVNAAGQKLEELFPQYKSTHFTWNGDIVIFKELIQKPQYADLGLEDIISIRDYCERGADEINKGLWAGTTDASILDKTDKLNRALDKLPNYIGTVYRIPFIPPEQSIEQFLSRYKPGTIVTEKAFTSTSKKRFAMPAKARMIIESKMGKDVSEISMLGLEEEVLFKSKTKFKVLEVTTEPDGTPVIHLEEITPSEETTALMLPEEPAFEVAREYGLPPVHVLERQLEEGGILSIANIKVTDPEAILLLREDFSRQHILDIYTFEKTGKLPSYVYQSAEEYNEYGKGKDLDLLSYSDKLDYWKKVLFTRKSKMVLGGKVMNLANLKEDLAILEKKLMPLSEEYAFYKNKIETFLLERTENFERIQIVYSNPEREITTYHAFIHETVHALDHLSGASKKIETLEEVAYEVFTDIRAYILMPEQAVEAILVSRIRTGYIYSDDLVRFLSRLGSLSNPNTNMEALLSHLKEKIIEDPSLREQLLTGTALAEIKGTDEEKINALLKIIDELKDVNPNLQGYIYVSPETKAWLEGENPQFIQTQFKKIGFSKSEIQRAIADPKERIPMLLKRGIDPNLLKGGVSAEVPKELETLPFDFVIISQGGKGEQIREGLEELSKGNNIVVANKNIASEIVLAFLGPRASLKNLYRIIGKKEVYTEEKLQELLKKDPKLEGKYKRVGYYKGAQETVTGGETYEKYARFDPPHPDVPYYHYNIGGRKQKNLHVIILRKPRRT